MKRYAKQKHGVIEFWYYANEVDVEIKRLQAQHQEDADLIAEQKREIEVLQKVRDEAEALRASEIAELWWRRDDQGYTE